MLRDLQRSFSAAIFDGSDALADRILPGHFPAEQLVQIYRHNVLDTLTTALGAVYPVTEKLVGAGFFGYAAHEYLREHRPLSANLHDFGGNFAGFLAGFAPAASLPYLPDMARLEWAWHRAFHAADAGALDMSQLASVPPERHPALRFVLHPSAQLVMSDYPIVRIFESNLEGFAGDTSINLADGGENALVIRRDLKVRVEPLAAADAALLAALARNQTLSDALDAALAIQPDFDLGPVLADHARRGTFSPIHAD